MDNKERIQSIIAMSSVASLKNSIFDFDEELVNEAIRNKASIREILGKDIKNYMGELKDYQTVGVGFMYFSKKSIIGDGTGLGKTAQISALLNILKSKGEMRRAIVAVESSATMQITRELNRFTGLRIEYIRSTKNEMSRDLSRVDWKKTDVIVIAHSALKSDTFSLFLASNTKNKKCSVFDTFILDESSVIKNNKTDIYSYTNNIAKLASRVHFLNATVFETHILDMYHQINILNDKAIGIKIGAFKARYCTYETKSYWVTSNGSRKRMYKSQISDYKNQEELRRKMTEEGIYFGRVSESLLNHKKNIYKINTVQASSRQVTAMKKHRYQEVLNCPSLIPEIGIKMIREDVPKLDALVDIVQYDIDKSKKIMIYCMHKDAQSSIEFYMKTIGRKPIVLNGETVKEEREQIIQKFNTGDRDIIITNIKKSINLGSADYCIMYTVETNPSKIEQIIGRIERHVDDRTKHFMILMYVCTPEYNNFVSKVKFRSESSEKLTTNREIGIVERFTRGGEY